MAKVVLLDQNLNTTGAATTEFSAAGIGLPDNTGATTETNQYATRRSTGTMSNLTCRIVSNAATGTSTYFAKINTTAGNLTVSIGAGLTGVFSDDVNTDAIAAGDEFDRAFTTGATGGITFTGSIAFAATTNSVATYITGEFTYTADTVNNFVIIAGRGSPFTGETEANHITKTAGTYKNGFALVRTNDYTAASTLRLRKNGADANIVMSITALTTGLFEDTSNTDSVVVDDVVAWRVVGSATGSNLTVGVTTVEFESTNNKYMISSGPGAGAGGIITADSFSGPAAFGVTSGASETNYQAAFSVNSKTSLLSTYIYSNGSGGAVTLTLRKNTANATQTVSISATATGRFTDTTNTDTFGPTDLISMFFDWASGSTFPQEWGILVETLDTNAASTPTMLLMGVGL